MEENTFDEVFRWICKFHGKHEQLDPQVRAEWWRRWRTEHDDVFCHAGEIATAKLSPGRFPSIEQMQHFISEAREILWQRVKDKEPKKPLTKYNAQDPRNVERGRRWMAGIIEITEGKRTADDLIGEMIGPSRDPNGRQNKN
jgi:hypothetical protein